MICRVIVVVEGPSAAGKSTWSNRWDQRLVVAELAQRRSDDMTRSRRNFDLHRRFGPLLHDWYGTLKRLEPGRVQWAP